MANSLTLVSHSPCEEWLERWFEIRWQIALETRLEVGTFNTNPKTFSKNRKPKTPMITLINILTKLPERKQRGAREEAQKTFLEIIYVNNYEFLNLRLGNGHGEDRKDVNLGNQ